MGQRLVITIKDGEQNLAAAYYHWSAYTSTAYKTVEPIVQTLLATTIPANKKLYAIRLLELTGAGLENTEELNVMQSLFPGESFNRATDRNDGLIAAKDDEAITDLIGAGEDYIDIDLSTGRIQFRVWAFFETDASYIECYEDDTALEQVETHELPADDNGKRTLLNWLSYKDFLELYGKTNLECGRYHAEYVDEDNAKMDCIVTAIC